MKNNKKYIAIIILFIILILIIIGTVFGINFLLKRKANIDLSIINLV